MDAQRGRKKQKKKKRKRSRSSSSEDGEKVVKKHTKSKHHRRSDSSDSEERKSKKKGKEKKNEKSRKFRDSDQSDSESDKVYEEEERGHSRDSKKMYNIAKPMDIRVKKTEILGNRDMPRNTETWRKVDITEKRAVILRTEIKKDICARAVKRKLRTTRNTEAVRKTGIEHKHTGDKYTKSWLSRCNERFEHFGKLK